MEALSVMVGHPAQQHSMRTSAALKEAGFLVSYVTPIYDKQGSLTKRVKRFLGEESQQRASSRKNAALDDSEVIQAQEGMALVLLLLQRFRISRIPFDLWLRLLAARFNRSIVRLVERNRPDVVVLYDTFAASAFTRLARTAPEVIRVLDMSAPAAPFTDRVMAELAAQVRPEMGAQVRKERRSLRYRASLAYATREIRMAQYFLAASEFTAKSLRECGVPDERIFRCRYGPTMPRSEAEAGGEDGSVLNAEHAPLRIVFLGTVTPRKGAFAFLSIAQQLQGDRFSFVAIGRNDDLGKVARTGSVRMTGHVTRSRVEAELRRADVLIFPSYADGFGFSVVEAMSSGLVPIVSRNAGASDLIVQGVNGFVVPPGDVANTVELLERLDNDREALRRLKAAAVDTAAATSWSDYALELREAIGHMYAVQESRAAAKGEVHG